MAAWGRCSARDTKLNRDVALDVLPDSFANDADGGSHGLPLDEALPIARQIAQAREAAYERGVVHRDLTPANIKVRPDGTVKVLDFGPKRPRGRVRLKPDTTAHKTQTVVVSGFSRTCQSPRRSRPQP